MPNLQAFTHHYYDSPIVPEWLSFVYSDLSETTHFPFGAARELIVRTVLEKLPGDRSVAYDVGCGGGQLSVLLASEGFTVHALDFSQTMLGEAAKLVAQRQLTDKVQCHAFDVTRSPVPVAKPDGDLAIAMGFVEYLDDISPFFSKTGQMLKPGGELVVEFRSRMFNATTGNRFTAAEADIGECIAKYQEYCAQAVPTAQHYDEMALAHRRAMEGAAKSGRPVTVALSQPFGFARHQHYISDITSAAEAHGFVFKELYGMHPHPFSSSMEAAEPWRYNLLAWEEQRFPMNPLVIATCSSLAAVFIRKG
jgi:SAM-dependent methyltransferase